MDGTIFVLSGSERLPEPWINLGNMLPGGSSDLLPGVSNISSSQRFSSSCDWLDKSCENVLSTSSSSCCSTRRQTDYLGAYRVHCSSEFALGKDSTGYYYNQWRDFGGRFFAWTGSLFVAGDHSAEVTTILSPLRKKNEELVCFKCEGKQFALCTGTSGSGRTGQMDAATPAVGRFLSDDHGELAYGADNNRRILLQYQHSFLGSSFARKTCRSHKDSNSRLSKKVQAGSLQSYETMVSCSTKGFLSSSLFRTLNFPENTCSKCFLKDFEIWGKTSTWCRHRQKLLASNDKESAAKELVNFDRQSLCKSILEQANSSPVVALICSKIARHGYLLRGRGAVVLLFKTSSEKENQFTVPDFRVASLSYVYLNDSPVNSECSGRHPSKFAYLCQLYDPECHYVISVTVDSYQEVCCNALSVQGDDFVSQMEDHLVDRFCAKLPLYILLSLNLSLDINDHGATLILTPVPGSGLSESGDEHKAREICFINIQQKLRQRGVSLRHQFPEVYRQLCAYTEMNAEFAPVSLFLFDSQTRKRFLCLIMPNSEPFCSWMEELLEELGQETIV